MIVNFKKMIHKILYKYSLHIHKSTMFVNQARIYTKYYNLCRKGFSRRTVDKSILYHANNFKRNGFCSFSTLNSTIAANEILKKIKEEESSNKWLPDQSYDLNNFFTKFPKLKNLFENEIKDLINSIYNSNFSIFFGVLYKSENKGKPPEGSQIWHTDGGPGTCINLMFCLSEVNEKNGSMQCLPWNISKKILIDLYDDFNKITTKGLLDKSNKIDVRKQKSNIIKDIINKNYFKHVYQPASKPGLIYAFRNNCIHAGGYTEPNQMRYVCVFHIYPNNKNIDFSQYLKKGINKTSPFPINPDYANI